MNAAIELHDSQVSAISQSGDAIVVRLAPAYVHRSAGRPGVDAGTGWHQTIDLVFIRAVIEAPLPDLPCTLDDGNLSGGAAHKNILPLPLAVSAPVSFEARGLDGEIVAVRAAGVSVLPVGDAVYVEEFPGW